MTVPQWFYLINIDYICANIVMPQFLLQADRYLFNLVNQRMANPFFDTVMPWLREPRFWIPLYVFIVVFCLWKYKKTGAIIILFLAITVGLADFTSATIIKNTVKRTRPCREQTLIGNETTRVGCGTGYSFPSTHATDHFAMSLFLIMVFKHRWSAVWLWALLWAFLVCFAQVYVGLHYPVDVLCGSLLGSAIGILMGKLHKKLQPQFYTT